MSAFFEIHSGLPREGPGDRASLDWALGQVDLRPDARILDAGCGPGADIAGLLDHAPAGRVVAIEAHAPFADAVASAFAGDPRVTAVTGDMARPDGRFDLIWCAGALYFLGVEAGLRGWRDHLAPGGSVVFSELAWTGDDRPGRAAAFWAEGYPAMTDRAGVLAQVEAAGYDIRAARFLPVSAWEAYYQPLQARIDALRASDPGPDLRAALHAEQAEIDLWRAHGSAWGYLQVVAEPR